MEKEIDDACIVSVCFTHNIIFFKNCSPIYSRLICGFMSYVLNFILTQKKKLSLRNEVIPPWQSSTFEALYPHILTSKSQWKKKPWKNKAQVYNTIYLNVKKETILSTLVQTRVLRFTRELTTTSLIFQHHGIICNEWNLYKTSQLQRYFEFYNYILKP